MSGIHTAILNKVKEELDKGLVDFISPDDPTRAGIVQIGPLQELGPDVLRISVAIFTNDPDTFVPGNPTGMDSNWDDDVYEIEIGSAITYNRRFSLKCRCLFSETRENADDARNITSDVRERIDQIILYIDWSGIQSDDGKEKVALGIMSEEYSSEMIQAGGPPDAYDFLIKVRFSVLTTRTGA
jgi:hypothetical protein